MPASARTANQIITSVLKRIGNETITTEAQQALADIVTRLCEDYRWPFLKKTQTGTIAAGATSTALPSDFADFWSEYSVHLVDPDTGTHIPLRTVSQAEYDTYTEPDVAGQASRVVVDWNARTWTTYPLPHKTYNYKLVYKYVPARITNFDTTIDGFPADAVLAQYLFAWACDYEDDDRAAAELQKAQLLCRQYLKRYNISPAKGDVAALSRSAFTPILPIR